MPTCKGCQHLFMKNGYPCHLAQSKNPACVSIYEQMQNYVPTNNNDLSQPPSPSQSGAEECAPGVYEHDEPDNINIDDNVPANIFEGNYFDTKAEDLEWPAKDEETEADGDGDIELEEEEMEAEGAVVEQERDWEPPVEQDGQDLAMAEEDMDMEDAPSNLEPNQLDNRAHRHEAEAPLQHQPHVVKFPLQSAEATLLSPSCQNGYYHYHQQLNSSEDSDESVWAPFSSKIDYEVAHWAKTRGPGSTSFSDLLEIEGVCDKLGLSYKNSCELNKIIDMKIPARRPCFQRKEILVAGKAFDVYCRDTLECVRTLYGDPEFAPYLVFVPEQHYTDQDETDRLYHDLHTGKWWWQTQILLAYLPTTKLEHITNKSARRQSLTNLFHACMCYVVEPLVEPGREGMEIMSGDGAFRLGHPLVACYIGDYPEQLLVTGVKTGECPKCDIPSGELGNNILPCHSQDLGLILDALTLLDEDPYEFTKACCSAGIKPLFHPFWEDLPHCNIYHTITLDGLVKHLILWIKSAFSEAEIDARCKHLPPNHNMHIFMKGLSILSRVSGMEHKQICRFLLGIIIDLRLPDGVSPHHLVHASIFIDLSIRSSFNLPKLHSLQHYVAMIQHFGTTNNYNTEYTERLHIDLAKDAHCTTNHKDEYMQMTLWLEHQEKMLWHHKFIQWRLSLVKQVMFAALAADYGAVHFRAALAHFVVQVTEPGLTAHRLENAAVDVILPMTSVAVFHKIRYNLVNIDGMLDNITVDAIHTRPARRDRHSRNVPARFDTALVNLGNGGNLGVEGYQVAQVQVVFGLSAKTKLTMFQNLNVPDHLAYVEWFKPFANRPEANHGMFKVTQALWEGDRQASIVPFSPVAPRDWTMSNVLDRCSTFWVNSFSDRDAYVTIF
ncbi:hypothetical protein EDD22DRAFT_976106 [Suillus occidentalis]|nr:hypothetical protein EDD22DRAFT_976106 [Suillus occidentalis]